MPYTLKTPYNIAKGCCIPFDLNKDFNDEYLAEIHCIRLVISKNYINDHFYDIIAWANIIENRLVGSYCTMESVLSDNRKELAMCKKYGADYFYIDNSYDLDSVL